MKALKLTLAILVGGLVTCARAELIGYYDDTFNFENANTRGAHLSWKDSKGTLSLVTDQTGELEVDWGNITAVTVDGANNPTDTLISTGPKHDMWPRTWMTDVFFVEGSVSSTVLPSGDYYFVTAQQVYQNGFAVSPVNPLNNNQSPETMTMPPAVLLADMLVQGITVGKDGSWGRMDVSLSNMRINNTIGSDVLNEFAQESGGVGAVQISFTGKPGENFLTSFFEGVSCTKYYTGTVGGGSGVPTPSEWAMVFMSLVVFAGYGLCRERLTPAASAISRC